MISVWGIQLLPMVYNNLPWQLTSGRAWEDNSALWKVRLARNATISRVRRNKENSRSRETKFEPNILKVGSFGVHESCNRHVYVILGPHSTMEDEMVMWIITRDKERPSGHANGQLGLWRKEEIRSGSQVVFQREGMSFKAANPGEVNRIRDKSHETVRDTAEPILVPS